MAWRAGRNQAPWMDSCVSWKGEGCFNRRASGRNRIGTAGDAHQKSASRMPKSSSMTRAVIVPMAEIPPPGWQCGPVM